MTSREDVEGFILSGGSSSRMGTPKGSLLVGGAPIIARVARVLSGILARISVVTDRPEEVDFLGLPTIPDIRKGCGPMGGLHAALLVAHTPSVMLISCDLPFVSDRLLLILLERHGRAPATVPRADSEVHPLCAVYDRSLTAAVEHHLGAQRLSMRKFLEEVGAEHVDLALLNPPVASSELMNVNSPEDLAAARAMAGG
ncbi:MAG: molybdenum cofactor guanylyltransferase [Bacteroidota bacterium]